MRLLGAGKTMLVTLRIEVLACALDIVRAAIADLVHVYSVLSKRRVLDIDAHLDSTFDRLHRDRPRQRRSALRFERDRSQIAARKLVLCLLSARHRQDEEKHRPHRATLSRETERSDFILVES